MNEQINTLLTNYQTLCQYCDQVFDHTYQALHPHMQCRQGCASCCLLETVTPLEAYIIASYLRTEGRSLADTLSARQAPSSERCVLLLDDLCAIYPARPIICRTHGLPLLYPAQGTIETCPLNFTSVDLATLDPEYLFNAEQIAENLTRLNLAFCMLAKQQESAGVRIPLRKILTGDLPHWLADLVASRPEES